MKEHDLNPLVAKQGFYSGIVVLCAVTGAVVGTIWAMALGKNVLAGIIIGVVINEIYWLNKGNKIKAAIKTKDETDNLRMFLIASSLMNRGILGKNIVVGVIGLIVWLIRYLVKG